MCNKEVYFAEQVTSMGKDWALAWPEARIVERRPPWGGDQVEHEAGPAMQPCSDPKVLGMVVLKPHVQVNPGSWRTPLQLPARPLPHRLTAGLPHRYWASLLTPMPSINLDPWEKKREKDLNRGLSEEDTQMTNNHMKNAQYHCH